MEKRTLSHYEIIEKIGEGGMGEVYRARDTKLPREVAVKVLAPELATNTERRSRFDREAAAIAALNHPNIVTIHALDEDQGVAFIVMELVDGETLADVIPESGLPLERFIEIAVPLADAISAAHAKGIAHRDIKPGNIMFDREGRVKVLDFGLAKLVETDIDTDRTVVSDGDDATREGQIVGTTAYMSPEQAEGRTVDQRSDIFSLGIVLYQMATGKRPFDGPTPMSVLSSIIKDDPPSVTSLKRQLPPKLGSIVGRCLAKSPGDRYQSAAELRDDLRDLTATGWTAPAGAGAKARRWPLVAVTVAAVVVLAAGAFWWNQKRVDERWARQTAIPKIEQLLETATWGGRGTERWDAFQLAREARERIGDDPYLHQLMRQIARPITIHSTPGGARVYAKPYAAPDMNWEYIGDTPIDTLDYVTGVLRIRLEKDGYEPIDDLCMNPYFVSTGAGYPLRTEGSTPAGMAFIPDSAAVLSISAAPAGLHMPGVEHLPPQATGEFLMDRHEVTNAEYKRFVDAGGYQKREFWKYPFVRDGETLSWEDAMALFVDATGRSGPATWEVGDFPGGRGDYPVNGISWFEAAAYAEFAGKSLPTIYHWDRVALTWASGRIVPQSNVGGDGPVPVGSTDGANRFGVSDMAGNVREWCFNESSRLGRFILGGGWSDPPYGFNDAYAQSPFDRQATNGVRCIQYLPGVDNRANLEQPVTMPYRDFMKEPVVSDEAYQLILKQYAYDKTPLNAQVEETLEKDDWTRVKVSFDAAYGGERMAAYLFFPKNGAPPYQPVVVFPGSGAIHTRSSSNLTLSRAAFFPKAGRVVVYPIYKSTYERGDGLASDYPEETNFWKDHVIMWSKDLGRTIDYLETRDDIQSDKIAYYGLSWGSAMAPMMLGAEPRIKAAVLVVAGLLFHRGYPEVEPVNFLPRITIPVLMCNGKYDFFFPYETSQVPMFKLLGTPDKDKRLVVQDGAHDFPRTELAKESLGWLDKYLGKVE